MMSLPPPKPSFFERAEEFIYALLTTVIIVFVFTLAVGVVRFIYELISK